MIKTICDSVNHTRFAKEEHLPDWARRDNIVTKGNRVDYFIIPKPNYLEVRSLGVRHEYHIGVIFT